MRYNQGARFYDRFYGKIQHAKMRDLVGMVDFKKDDLVLDAGCGTGICKEFIHSKIIGVDSSIEMLKIGRLKDVVLGRCESLPFKNCVFDKVICISVLENIKQKKKAILEMVRVLKYGGTIVVTWPNRFYFEVDEDIMKRFEDFNEIFLSVEDIGFIARKVSR